MGNGKDQWVHKVLGTKVDRQQTARSAGSAGEAASEKQAKVTALKDHRKKLQAEYDKLAAKKPPDEEARDLDEKLVFVKTLLEDTSKDAAERAKQIQDYVKK